MTWGDAAAKNIDIRNISHDILLQLAETVGVSVHLAIKTGPVTSTFVEKIDGALYTVHNTILGAEIVWQCSACGKVLFAWSSQEDQQRILDTIQFKPYTGQSILTAEAFAKDIAQTWQNGYAMDMNEWTENVYGIGVPVFDHSGKVIAAISCAILAIEMQDKDFDPYVEYLKDASAKITARMSD